MKGDHSEVARKLIHVAMGGFALLLRWLSWPQALALAAAALLFNVFVLPRFAPAIYRPGDRERVTHGIVFYPFAVLLLVACFPGRPDIAAAAWGILAAGDGFATLAGRAIGGARWPWNGEKTVAGTAAFVLLGTAAGTGLALWCQPLDSVPTTFAVVGVPLAALAAAFVETIPVRLDDNLSIAASAGTILWLVSMVIARHAGHSAGASLEGEFVMVALWARLGTATIANVAVAALGYAARSVSISGALGGATIGIVVFTSLGWQGWTLLLVTFLSATVATRAGRGRKQALGIAESREGRRGAGNAIANTGVAAIAATLAGLDVHPAATQLAFVTALVAGGSDTIASEIGKAFGRRTWSITSLAGVPAGTSGAMSVEGTIAGVLGAIGLGAVAIALGLLAPSWLPLVVVCATLGAVAESWLGATLEGPGILNNDLLNFINTTAAAGAAVLIAAVRR
jgi:uncharacterized protein (TIGR00297 family)